MLEIPKPNERGDDMELMLIIPVVIILGMFALFVISPILMAILFVVESFMPDRTDYTKEYDPDGF